MAQEILLVVEDNHPLREGLREMLGLEGYIVYTAANGREALEKMESITPDLILSDIAMPEMDGYAFFKKVRERLEWIAIPFLFLTARGEKEDVLLGKDMGAEDYLVKPITRKELVTAVRARLDRSQQLNVATLAQSYEHSLTALANAIELRDPFEQGHVDRVKIYALLLGEQLGVRGKQLENLRFGAILHDIGKIHVSEDILVKPAPLDEHEWAEIKRHSLTGSEMLRDIPYLAGVIPIVRHHHERWDGNGYPDRLLGEEIPLLARIVCLADAFDTMLTTRPYRPALTFEQAYAEVLANAGKQFDPEVVRAFQSICGEMNDPSLHLRTKST
jgi:putative two-component system response regulator